VSEDVVAQALEPIHQLFKDTVEGKKEIKATEAKLKKEISRLHRMVEKDELFNNPAKFFSAVYELGAYVGECSRLVAKYRQPRQPEPQPEPVRLRGETAQRQQHVIVQSQPIETKGFWASRYGFLSVKEQVDLLREQMEAERNRPYPVTDTNVVTDELRPLLEVRALLNEFINLADYYYDRASFFQGYSEESMKSFRMEARKRLTQIGNLLLSGVRWAVKVDLSENRVAAGQIMLASARVAEAHAMQPFMPATPEVTINQLEEFVRRYRPGGISFTREVGGSVQKRMRSRGEDET